MQSFPVPYWPRGSLPRTPAPGRPQARPRSAAGWQPGPTLMFSGVALAIFGTATLLATCIASAS